MLDKEDYTLLKSILSQLSKPIYVYGSRAKGTATRFSDIDLYIDAAISEEELEELKARCEASDLSIKVDLTTNLSPEFLAYIRQDFVLFK